MTGDKEGGGWGGGCVGGGVGGGGTGGDEEVRRGKGRWGIVSVNRTTNPPCCNNTYGTWKQPLSAPLTWQQVVDVGRQLQVGVAE